MFAVIFKASLEATEAMEVVVITKKARQITTHPLQEQIQPTILTKMTIAKIFVSSITR